MYYQRWLEMPRLWISRSSRIRFGIRVFLYHAILDTRSSSCCDVQHYTCRWCLAILAVDLRCELIDYSWCVRVGGIMGLYNNINEYNQFFYVIVLCWFYSVGFYSSVWSLDVWCNFYCIIIMIRSQRILLCLYLIRKMIWRTLYCWIDLIYYTHLFC